jgi:ornithine racemase
MYPKLIIDPNKYLHNLNQTLLLLKSKGISMMAVTKVFLADQKLVDMINQTDIEYIADSRIINLKKIKTNKKKVLLRLPSKSEAKQTVAYTDISLNSEIDVIQKLNDCAKSLNKIHGIILMFDIGDLREGIYYQDPYLNIVEKILKFDHIKLVGIGSNLTCYGGVIPTFTTMKKLVTIKDHIEKNFDQKLDIISGGNSSLYPFIKNEDYPKEINHVRLGELLILGRETSFGELIPEMHDDVITLKAELIELKRKPSYPEGELGLNAFGEKVSFVDYGNIKRGILAIGKQDVHHEHLIPEKGIRILGSSSDHLILEIDQDQSYQVGDFISFKLTYGGILSLMQSKYVRRVYVKSL